MIYVLLRDDYQKKSSYYVTDRQGTEGRDKLFFFFKVNGWDKLLYFIVA